MAYCVISRWKVTATATTATQQFVFTCWMFIFFIVFECKQQTIHIVTANWNAKQRAEYEHNVHIIGPEYYDDHDEFVHFSTRLFELVPLSNHANTVIIMIIHNASFNAHCRPLLHSAIPLKLALINCGLSPGQSVDYLLNTFPCMGLSCGHRFIGGTTRNKHFSFSLSLKTRQELPTLLHTSRVRKKYPTKRLKRFQIIWN